MKIKLFSNSFSLPIIERENYIFHAEYSILVFKSAYAIKPTHMILLGYFHLYVYILILLNNYSLCQFLYKININSMSIVKPA